MALVVALVGSACLADADVASKAWEALLAQPDPAAAETHIRAVLEACDNDPARLKALIAADTAYPERKPGWLRQSVEVRDKAKRYQVEFLVRIPAGYTPKRSWPLLLAAHGQGGNARSVGVWMPRLLGRDREKYVLVCPTMPGPKHYSGKAYQEQAYLKPLAWARRSLNVDDDRIYVSGYSQGGHSSWHLATMYPRLFAAAVPMAGIPAFEGAQMTYAIYLENLEHLPLWAIWGEKDTAPAPAWGNVDFCRAATRRIRQLGWKHYKPTELLGRGHGGCFPSPREFAKYLAAHKRIAPPEAFRRKFHLAHHARGYYVEALRFTRTPIDFNKPIKIVVKTSRDPDSVDPQAALRQHIAGRLFYLSVKLDRSRNRLTVRGGGVRKVRIYVADGMFAPSRTVTLLALGKVWRGKLPVSARCMLTHYLATRDQTRLVINEVEIATRGKPVVRYK